MTTLQYYPIEGDIIQNTQGSFFEVIGFEHPRDRVVAYIKYLAFQQKSDRFLVRDNKIQYFQKLLNLSDRTKTIREIFPLYIYQDDHYDFPFHAIPISDIQTHYRPEAFFRELMTYSSEKTPDLFTITKEFCEFLTLQAGIPLSTIGVTGSQLIGLQNSQSDIDLIVYGNLNSLKIRQVIRDCFQGKISNSNIQPYILSDFKNLYKSRVDKSSLSFYEFSKYEVRKLHQGKFKGKEFFIRFFEFDKREDYQQTNQFDIQEIRQLGRIKITGQVRGDKYWWMTPARVEIGNICVLDQSNLNPDAQEHLQKHNLNVQMITQTYTLRGRFIENIRLLETFEADGVLELVIPKNKFQYLQITVGSNPTDYLKLI